MFLFSLFGGICFHGCKTGAITDYAVRTGNTFSIELEANHTTGYSWHWDNCGSVSIVDSLGCEYAAESNRIGSNGKEIWTFIGKNRGEDSLVFIYRRPFEQVAVDKRTFRIRVN
jgi:predicted secreted protein